LRGRINTLERIVDELQNSRQEITGEVNPTQSANSTSADAGETNAPDSTVASVKKGK
jgi:hypothetical protein